MLSKTEHAMRYWLDKGVWPTAIYLNHVAEQFGLRRNPHREDLNGRECRLRERLAEEYGWHRVEHGRGTRWERMYFYCIACGHLSDVKSELYIDVPKKLCSECQALDALGWLE